MIYHGIWYYAKIRTAVTAWNKVHYPDKNVGDLIDSKLPALEKFIKESEDDSFVFILGVHCNAYRDFFEWVDKVGLREYIVLETKGVTNPVHTDRQHNLVTVVLQSLKHFQRDQRAIETEVNKEIA